MSALDELRGLPTEHKLAGAAATALAFSLLLPWYEKNFLQPGQQRLTTEAFRNYSFVELAVLMVAAGVLYLLWARAERRSFHLPGGDGTVISVAGGWALLLIIYRTLDKPDVAEPLATVGLHWGIFGGLAAAAALVAAGLRVRAARAPEPPNPTADAPTRPQQDSLF